MAKSQKSTSLCLENPAKIEEKQHSNLQTRRQPTRQRRTWTADNSTEQFSRLNFQIYPSGPVHVHPLPVVVATVGDVPTRGR
ncbi:hypothetical protein CC1G_00078 [Coprinopsis cinerea okayama7|uniref:Uncharacterized protein n=1 Tax=Coprinopsis cinerea (strain Okayama-7 / 130 / ATCC MYA-4618 / FGSC 9003) TaxID=240176 RepID=D6RMU7_COPC7|nr:hypothetical protein CC1G_00078 [Coprinopsis cinerea okayama7\|eukprot:XP_002911152.1 hypothetical protein CC1G_00078 [Coprinopsis cinerea okayama7\